MQSSLARVGTDVKLFEILSENTQAMSSGDLAERTGMAPSVMSKSFFRERLETDTDDFITERLLRYYQSMRMVSQTGDDEFAANNVSRALTPPNGIGIKYM